MKKLILSVALIAIAAVALVAVSASAEEEPMPAGETAFTTLKCNMCHAVSTAEIESKTKSEKMFGGDLVNLESNAKELAGYINQEIEKDGKPHKKEFKGTDEELQALVDWLLEQKAE